MTSMAFDLVDVLLVPKRIVSVDPIAAYSYMSYTA
jgi:hypothetical protein